MKVHLSVTVPNRFGGVTTKSLCGRTNKACNDAMNLGAEKDVTCAFCLAMLVKRRLRGAMEKVKTA